MLPSFPSGIIRTRLCAAASTWTLSQLGRNGYSTMMRDYTLRDGCGSYIGNTGFFSRDSGTDVSRFLADYLPQYHDSRDHGLWCFITCNHDTPRPAAGLTDAERRLAFAWIFTMPGAPFLYYGDELGMDYRVIPTKEGGYHRTGSRTPMQWDAGPNLGFSEARRGFVPARGSRRAAHRAGAGA